MSRKSTTIFLILVLTLLILIIVFQVNKPKETRNIQPGQIVWKYGQQEDPLNYVSIPNHSEITNKETINLPVGKATFIRFLHGGTAVNPEPDKVIYWIYIQKPIPNKPNTMKTFFLEGEVTGKNEQEAKKELIQFAQKWKINENVVEPSPTFYSNQVAMIGVEGEIGILGPDFIANKGNKYMWHFWGTKEELELKPFRVEAINVKTKQKVEALMVGAGTPQERLVWEYDSIGGPNNGADAHTPSNLKLPSSGLWQLNAYLGGILKGSIIIDVKDK
jgi:hypothetical protein